MEPISKIWFCLLRNELTRPAFCRHPLGGNPCEANDLEEGNGLPDGRSHEEPDDPHNSPGP